MKVDRSGRSLCKRKKERDRERERKRNQNLNKDFPED